MPTGPVQVDITLAPWWKPYVLGWMYVANWLRIAPPAGHIERMTRRATRITPHREQR